MNDIRYNSGYFYDDPNSCCNHQNPLPDYMHIDRSGEQVPQLFGILSFCGERGPAGVTLMTSELNADLILNGDGTVITHSAFTLSPIENDD